MEIKTVEKAYDAMKETYTKLKTAEEIKEELEKAKKLNPDDSEAFMALQMSFSTWLLNKLGGPISAIREFTTEAADATHLPSNISVPGSYRVAGHFAGEMRVPEKPDDFIAELHDVLKDYNLFFDTTKDLIVFIDGEPTYKVPKETMEGLDYVQKFVHSAELVYKDITDKSMGDKFADIKRDSEEFHKHMDKAQSVKVEFTVDPQSFGADMAKELGKTKEANEGLYSTPKTSTSMSSTTSSFETREQHAKPSGSVSNSGGAIAVCLLIPIIVIPFGGPISIFGSGGCKIL